MSTFIYHRFWGSFYSVDMISLNYYKFPHRKILKHENFNFISMINDLVRILYTLCKWVLRPKSTALWQETLQKRLVIQWRLSRPRSISFTCQMAFHVRRERLSRNNVIFGNNISKITSKNNIISMKCGLHVISENNSNNYYSRTINHFTCILVHILTHYTFKV